MSSAAERHKRFGGRLLPKAQALLQALEQLPPGHHVSHMVGHAHGIVMAISNLLRTGDHFWPREVSPLDPVEGDVLPRVGSRVLIHLARQDEWVEHTVVGYYVWRPLKEGDGWRVNVRVVDANGYQNSRSLEDVRPVT